jgi:hypothetical protein
VLTTDYRWRPKLGSFRNFRLRPCLLLSLRYFVGGSDARIIMGNDEAALIRLWREKRGEVEPEDLSGNLIVQLGVATEDPEPALVRGQYRPSY